MEGADAVVNFAAESHVDRSIADQDAFADAVIGTGVLLDAARELGVDATCRSRPTRSTARSRRVRSPRTRRSRPPRPTRRPRPAGDLLVTSHVHTHGIEAVICRGSNNYGPRQYPEKLIPLMILNALHGDPLPVYGDGRTCATGSTSRTSRARSTPCSRDARRGLQRRRPRRAREPRRGHAILELTGRDESLIEYVTDRKGHDRRYSLSSDKVRARSAGSPGGASTRACRAPSTGTATTSGGGSRSAQASTASTTSSTTGGPGLAGRR